MGGRETPLHGGGFAFDFVYVPSYVIVFGVCFKRYSNISVLNTLKLF
jgi:hypothetical protein